jgi:hypothetical protein
MYMYRNSAAANSWLFELGRDSGLYAPRDREIEHREVEICSVQTRNRPHVEIDPALGETRSVAKRLKHPVEVDHAAEFDFPCKAVFDAKEGSVTTDHLAVHGVSPHGIIPAYRSALAGSVAAQTPSPLGVHRDSIVTFDIFGEPVAAKRANVSFPASAAWGDHATARVRPDAACKVDLVLREERAANPLPIGMRKINWTVKEPPAFHATETTPEIDRAA